MDFSNFNSAEQAHMTKVIEKRQVWHSFNIEIFVSYMGYNRCKIFFECTLISSKSALWPAAMTSQAKPYLQKRFFILPWLTWRELTVCEGNMHHELHREVYQAFGKGRSPFCWTKRRYVSAILFVDPWQWFPIQKPWTRRVSEIAIYCNNLSTPRISIRYINP